MEFTKTYIDEKLQTLSNALSDKFQEEARSQPDSEGRNLDI